MNHEITDKDIARFESHIDKSDSCWIWNKTVIAGYGAFAFPSRYVRAHRVAYQIYNGDLKDGMVIMHICDNPLCVNPAHLKQVTQKENILDCHRKGRAACKKEENGRNKLKESDIKRIRDLSESGNTQIQIAKQYGVDQSTVSYILSGKKWSHVR